MSNKTNKGAPAPSIVHVVEGAKAPEELKKATNEAELEVAIAKLREQELDKLLRGAKPRDNA